MYQISSQSNEWCKFFRLMPSRVTTLVIFKRIAEIEPLGSLREPYAGPNVCGLFFQQNVQVGCDGSDCICQLKPSSTPSRSFP